MVLSGAKWCSILIDVMVVELIDVDLLVVLILVELVMVEVVLGVEIGVVVVVVEDCVCVYIPSSCLRTWC